MNRFEVFLGSVVFILTLLFFGNYVESSREINDMKLQMKHMQIDFEVYKSDMNRKYKALGEKIKSVDSNTRKSFVNLGSLENRTQWAHDSIVDLRNITTIHSQKLIRLSNGTSNADVLDELKRVKQDVENTMQHTSIDINRNIAAVKHNVTAQLEESQHEMEETVQSVNEVVHKASRKIKSMQIKVTDQLSNVSDTLNTTLVTVNSIVSHAISDINHQVVDIQDNINEYVAFANKQFAAENDFVKYQLAGTFTLLACLISLYHITQHQRHFSKPVVQRRIMAIIWMVPVYSMTAWLSLVFGSAGGAETLFAAVKDIYEAYVVYSFFGLLMAVLQDGRGLGYLIDKITAYVDDEQNAVIAAQRLGKPLPVEHIKPPFPCCYDYHVSTRIAITWLYQCQLMVMQFVLLKPLLTVMPALLILCGVDYYNIPLRFEHSPGAAATGASALIASINFHCPHLYLLLIENVSVALAFYGLLSFFHGIEKELAWCDPWPKFLCIKGVVFVTFWQGVTISIMSSLGMVDEKAALQIQNLLICIEMLVASLAHIYIFPYKEWEEGFKREKQMMLRDTLAFKDFMRDVKSMVSRWSAGGGDLGSPLAPDKHVPGSVPVSRRGSLNMGGSMYGNGGNRGHNQGRKNSSMGAIGGMYGSTRDMGMSARLTGEDSGNIGMGPLNAVARDSVISTQHVVNGAASASLQSYQQAQPKNNPDGDSDADGSVYRTLGASSSGKSTRNNSYTQSKLSELSAQEQAASMNDKPSLMVEVQSPNGFGSGSNHLAGRSMNPFDDEDDADGAVVGDNLNNSAVNIGSVGNPLSPLSPSSLAFTSASASAAASSPQPSAAAPSGSINFGMVDSPQSQLEGESDNQQWPGTPSFMSSVLSPKPAPSVGSRRGTEGGGRGSLNTPYNQEDGEEEDCEDVSFHSARTGGQGENTPLIAPESRVEADGGSGESGSALSAEEFQLLLSQTRLAKHPGRYSTAGSGADGVTMCEPEGGSRNRRQYNEIGRASSGNQYEEFGIKSAAQRNDAQSLPLLTSEHNESDSASEDEKGADGAEAVDEEVLMMRSVPSMLPSQRSSVDGRSSTGSSAADVDVIRSVESAAGDGRVESMSEVPSQVANRKNEGVSTSHTSHSTAAAAVQRQGSAATSARATRNVSGSARNYSSTRTGNSGPKPPTATAKQSSSVGSAKSNRYDSSSSSTAGSSSGQTSARAHRPTSIASATKDSIPGAKNKATAARPSSTTATEGRPSYQNPFAFANDEEDDVASV